MDIYALVGEHFFYSLCARFRNTTLVGTLCLLIVSCGNGLTNESSCNDFYKDGINFSLNIAGGHKRFFLESGQKKTQNFSVSATITKVSDQTINRTIVCKPSWIFDTDGIVTVNPLPNFQGDFVLAPTEQTSGANALGSIVKITAKVFGTGSPVQGNIWAVVTNEGESNEGLSNNGPPGAHELANRTATIGSLSQDDPVDWFLLKVSARKAYQIKLNTPNQDSTGLEIQGSVYQIKTTKSAIKPRVVNEDILEFIPNAMNTIRVNNSDNELVLYVKIEPKDISTTINEDPIAYKLIPVVSDPTAGSFRPIAFDDTFSNVKIDIADQELDVLKNDDDKDGNLSLGTLTITRGPVSNKATATVKDGKILYSPNVGFQGGDVLFYTVKDNVDNISNEAIVLITVK